MTDEPEFKTAILDAQVVLDAAREVVADRPCLIEMAGPHTGRMHRIKDRISIGRGDEMDIRILADGVSRKHALVWVEGDQVLVRDLGSTNGTYLNNERVTEPEPIESGDKIRLGPTVILKFAYQDYMEEELQRELYEAALRDSMTRAYNKRYFIERLRAEFAYAARHNAPLSLIMFDLDHFKKLNDTHGHLAGDYVLMTIANIISRSIRAEDTFARYGGEEFAIVCRGIGKDAALQFANRVLNVVRQAEFEYQDQRLNVSVSIGLAHLGSDMERYEQLIERADQALYTAKRGGRDRIVEAE